MRVLALILCVFNLTVILLAWAWSHLAGSYGRYFGLNTVVLLKDGRCILATNGSEYWIPLWLPVALCIATIVMLVVTWPKPKQKPEGSFPVEVE